MAKYDPDAWGRIPEYGKDQADLISMTEPQVMLATITGFLKDGDSVLEVACGAKGFAPYFRDAPFTYTGLDYTEAYLALARERWPMFTFVLGDARKLPFDDKSFDAVLNVNLLLHLPPEDAMKAFNEMLRVTRKVVVIWSPFAENDNLGSLRSVYAEKDGNATDFLDNTYSYSRFQVKGWVTYVHPPYLLMLVSQDNRILIEGDSVKLL